MSAAAPRRNSIFKQLMSVHWWMSGFYLILYASGITMAQLQGEVSYRELLYAAHKSFGVLVLLLLGWRLYLLLRVWGRKYSKHLPKFTRNWYFQAGLHTCLYLLMLAVPLSGYWLSNSYQANNISLFGIPMPDVFPVNSDARSQASDTHGYTSKIMAATIVAHIIIQHKVVKANWRRFLTWAQKLAIKA